MLSILIHLASVPLYDKLQKRKEAEKPTPIEVSYLPNEEKMPEPTPLIPQNNEPVPPAYVPEIVDNTDRETTFDETQTGGEAGSPEIEDTQQREQVASLPKFNPIPEPMPPPSPVTPPDEPSGTEVMDSPQGEILLNNSPDKNIEKEPEPYTAGLMDTKDIIERIANRQKEQPKGQDTASYNKFEAKYASYFAKFKNNVYQVWNYPSESVMRGETGIVQVSFSILKDGSIVNIKLLGSSGYPALDREVMRVLKNMRRTPLPASYELDQLNIDDASFTYSIGRGWDIL